MNTINTSSVTFVKPTNVATKNNISICFNQVQNNLFIEFDDSNEATIEIFTEDGQILMQKTITSSQNSISTSTLTTKVYWVKLTSNKGIITKKIISN